jgi:hypothetical protein
VEESEKAMYAPQLKAAVPDADDKEQYFKVNVFLFPIRLDTDGLYHRSNGLASPTLSRSEGSFSKTAGLTFPAGNSQVSCSRSSRLDWNGL